MLVMKRDPNIDGARHRTHYDIKGIQYVHSGADVGYPAAELAVVELSLNSIC